jgi:hypothetical protein
MKTVITSIFFIAVGIFFFVYSLNYTIGTLSNMGAGFFPISFAVMLIILGLIILVEGFKNGFN